MSRVNLRAIAVILQFTHLRGSRRPHMLVHRVGLLALLATGLVACWIGIPDLNTHPSKYYQESVSFTARVSRMQRLAGDETLFELADAHEHRILAHITTPTDVQTDDWVKVTGVLVPEARIGDRIVYDVVEAESVEGTSAPWLRNLF